MERPRSKVRKPELLYIVGCEGKNQEPKYFEKVQKIINSIPSRKYEEALELAQENRIDVGNTNYCFDLWLILHKIDYFDKVSNQDDYATDLKKVYGLHENANIKRETNVDTIIQQIKLKDIADAIRRAEEIEKINSKVSPHLTTIKRLTYYDNPVTKMHIILKMIFNKAGVKIG